MNVREFTSNKLVEDLGLINNLLAARALSHKCFFKTYSSSTNVLEGKNLEVRVAYRRFHFVCH